MTKTCVICGGDEAGGDTLLEAPCQRHWVCTDDIGSFFERATENESLYPPKCCGQIFLLDTYEAHVPFDVQWAYQMREQGDYSVFARYRVYCANPSCSKFLSPNSHVQDSSTDVNYAICMDDACGKLTCTACKALLNGIEGHSCEENEDYKTFKQTATEKGFQECPNCASTVELAEACNHITCECGADFCYICGESWPGMHGCPHYGPAIYDEEGYNQDGYHRATGLDREGRTRREQARLDPDGDDEDEGSDEEDEDPNDDHFVLQHLFEEQGITFPLPDELGDDAVDSDGNGDNENEVLGSEHGESGSGGDWPGEVVDEERHSDGALPPSTATVADLYKTTDEPVEAAVKIAEDFHVVAALTFDDMQGVEHFAAGSSSSSTTPDEELPGTPMEVDSVGEIKQEREHWIGPRGSWPDDEKL